jgi:hypothetical protein
VNNTYVTEDQVSVDIFRSEDGPVYFRARDLSDPATPSWAMELTTLDRAELASLLLDSLL